MLMPKAADLLCGPDRGRLAAFQSADFAPRQTRGRGQVALMPIPRLPEHGDSATEFPIAKLGQVALLSGTGPVIGRESTCPTVFSRMPSNSEHVPILVSLACGARIVKGYIRETMGTVPGNSGSARRARIKRDPKRIYQFNSSGRGTRTQNS